MFCRRANSFSILIQEARNQFSLASIHGFRVAISTLGHPAQRITYMLGTSSACARAYTHTHALSRKTPNT